MQVNRRFLLVYGLVVVAGVLAVFLLDGEGTFIYFGYLLAYAIAGTVLLAGLVLFGRVSGGRRRLELAALLLLSAVMILAVLVCPTVRTSKRKGFFLAAMALKPGMTVDEVRARLGPYDAHPFAKYPGSLTFSYQDRKGTADTVVVSLSTTSDRVSDIRFSAD